LSSVFFSIFKSSILSLSTVIIISDYSHNAKWILQAPIISSWKYSRAHIASLHTIISIRYFPILSLLFWCDPSHKNTHTYKPNRVLWSMRRTVINHKSRKSFFAFLLNLAQRSRISKYKNKKLLNWGKEAKLQCASFHSLTATGALPSIQLLCYWYSIFFVWVGIEYNFFFFFSYNSFFLILLFSWYFINKHINAYKFFHHFKISICLAKTRKYNNVKAQRAARSSYMCDF
jgi:hypothetical protein